MTTKNILIWSMILTFLMEVLTVIMRFFFKLESTKATASTIGVLTGGIRIHHGYIGVLLIILSVLFIKKAYFFGDWLLITGIALLCSDIIHHFIILWIYTGNPEFDIFYHK